VPSYLSPTKSEPAVRTRHSGFMSFDDEKTEHGSAYHKQFTLGKPA
jgi:hypothetical protein